MRSHKNFPKLLPGLLIIFIILVSNDHLYAQVIQQTFNTSGTFVCPPGVTSITIESWGGGGAGGGVSISGSKQAGGGGGGGGYTKITNYAVTAGNSYSVTVGVGGAGTSGNGSSGGSSFFGVNICKANGGNGGIANNGTGGTGGSGTFSGGSGFKGAPDNAGGGGGSAGISSSGNNAYSTSGAIAITGGGQGGDGGTSNPSVGENGGFPGGGGGGARKGGGSGIKNGGDGADGMVVISYLADPCATLYWAGLGSTISGGTTGSDFNTPSNWSINSSFYAPAGMAPGPCNEVVIRVELTSSINTLNISFSQSSTSIKSLDFSVKSISGNSSVFEGGLRMGNQSLTILGNTTLYVENNVYGRTTQLTLDGTDVNSLIVYGGNLVTSAANIAGGGGECIVYPFSNPVNTVGKGKFVLKGDATLTGVGDDANPQLNKPATLVFDGTGTQTITNNNSNGYPIFLGFNTIIGETNTPRVIFTGSNAQGFKSINNLTLKNGVIVEIDPIQSLDRNGSGTPGTFTMGTNSTLIVKGDNFPAGYNTAYNLDATSTVEYKSNNGVSQTVRGITYGNLILTNANGSGNTIKTLSANTSVKGNITVNDYVTFEQGSYSLSRTVPGGIFSLASNAYHNLAGSYPSNFSAVSLHSLSTTNYNGAGAQNIAAVNYGNLILSNKSNKTVLGNITVAGNLNIEGTAVFLGGSYSHSVFGSWNNNSTFTPQTSTINFSGSYNQLITGSSATAFYNLVINKSATGNSVLNGSSDKTFSATNLTVTKGTLELQSVSNDYNVGNLVVAPNGILKHSVSWDATLKALRVSGNFDVTGIFYPTVRSHVAMYGSGSKTIRSGDNPASFLNILTFSDGNFSANGTLKTNMEVWAMFGTGGSFSTGGNNVTFATLLNNNGTININGGSLTVLSSASIGYANSAGILNISGGTFTVNGDFTNNVNAVVNISNAPQINIKGDFGNNGTYNQGQSTTTFYGSIDETIWGSKPLTFYNLKISGVNVIQTMNLNVLNDLEINNGILDMQDHNCNRLTPGGAMTLLSGSTIKVRAAGGGAPGSNFPANYATYNLADGSTVSYSGSVDQQIFSTPSYANLTLTNTGIKTTGGALTIRGNLTLKLNAVFKAGNFNHHIAGDWINDASATAFQYDNSTVTFNGSTPQTIGGTFATSFNALVMDNNSSINISPAVQVAIYESLTATGPGKTLNTNDNLTMKSIQTKTSFVGDMTGNSINGKATVERYITGRKAWRFISVPTFGGQTIKQSWQEGAVNQSSNPAPGYGIQLSGEMSNWAALGFDKKSVSPSIKYYDAVSGNWIGVSNTNATPIDNTKGYMVFVRGDRLSTDVNSPETQTNLRTKDNLKVGTQPTITVNAGKFESIGNPYASPIDFTKITKGASIAKMFYLWDPFINGTYNYGGYQTFTEANNWIPVPGGSSAHPAGVPNTIIQSGEAFFVKGNDYTPFSNYKVTISENAKVAANPNTFSRPGGSTGNSRRQFIRTSLMNIDGQLLDGNAVAFDESFSNEVDGDDALKLGNSGENIGLKRFGKSLSVEARSEISSPDTIYFNMSNLQKINYKLQILPVDMDANTSVYLYDNYKKTSTPISVSDTNYYPFAVNNESLSYASDRFKIVLTPAVVLPVGFAKINAFEKDGKVLVQWEVATETNVQTYQAERSADGNQFVVIGNQNYHPQNSGKYEFTDQQPLEGWNFYRIKSIDTDGKSGVSSIAKINIAKIITSINVFPNPVVGNMLFIKLNNQSTGDYKFILTNSIGQKIKSVQTKISGNQTIEMHWDKGLAKGIYTLQIFNGANEVETIRINY